MKPPCIAVVRGVDLPINLLVLAVWGLVINLRFLFLDLTPDQVQNLDPSQMRNIQLTDFLDSLKRVRCSVPSDTMHKYEQWNLKFGDVTM